MSPGCSIVGMSHIRSPMTSLVREPTIEIPYFTPQTGLGFPSGDSSVGLLSWPA